ncbi:MAG TPA: response regulator [Methylophaga aminisulfidivorans]|uniref:Chemotaxis protein CheA n=1 Tax=Methylophaga aminisulfidivorans TaxID=230105 RepID=A0A7C2ABW2_9GAMM|nr:response regulator [Methylophaga aminisulfidivorans]
MAQLLKGNYDALVWLQDELQQSLAQALSAMNVYLDAEQEESSLSDCIESLYQVNGTLEMLNLSGAAMLTAEMQNAVKDLHNKRIADSQATEDAIVKTLLLLPNYLKQLNNDFQDHPLLLIDVINELKTARKEPALSELDLFSPSLSIALPESITPTPNRSVPSLTVEKTKLGQVFQVLLLNWLRKQDLSSLKQMTSIVHYLRVSSSQERVCLFWWTAEVLLQALENDKTLVNDAKVKQLLGKLVPSIKQQSLSGESVIQNDYPVELEKRMLLAIARCNSDAPAIVLLKDSLKLHFFDNRQHIQGMSDNALTDANSALLEQLQELKEQLNNHEHDQSLTIELCTELNEQLKQMADTLALLSEYEASNLLHHQVEQLDVSIELKQIPDNDRLTALADALLQVEVFIQSTNKSSDDDLLRTTVMSECLLELSNIKETLTLINQSGQYNQDLRETEQQLILVAGSLNMLTQSRAASLLQATADQLNTYQASDAEFTQSNLHRLADIIACAELYMEGIRQHGHADEAYLTDAEFTLENFDSDAPLDTPINTQSVLSASISNQQESYDTPQPSDASELPPSNDNKDLDFSQANSDVFQHDIKDKAQALITDMGSAEQWHFSEDIDPEVALVFIEEALEVIGYLETSTSNWLANNNHDALLDTRRHFHTLKGSGRMAGASAIADLAWRAEETLNAIIEQNKLADDAVKSTILSAFEQLPPLLKSFAHIPETDSEEILTTEFEIENEPTEQLNTEIPRLTSVERYIRIRQARDQARLNIDLSEYEVTGESPYEQAQFEINASFPTSVERYIQLHHIDIKPLPLFEASAEITNVERYIQSHLNEKRPSETSVEHFIWEQSRINLNPMDEESPANLKPLSSVDRYLIALSQRDTSVSLYLSTLNDAGPHLSPEIDDEQQELLGIFAVEALQHISTLKEALTDIVFSKQITQTILRSVHSLKGCANIAGVKPIARLATEMDQAVKRLHANDYVLDNHQMTLMNEVAQGFSDLLQNLTDNAPQPDLIQLSSYISELTPSNELTHAPVIDPEFLVILLEETDELLEVYTEQLEHWRQMPNDSANNLAISETLSKLEQTAADAQQRQIASTYASLNKLIRQCEPSHKGLNALLEQGYEQLNHFIESLLQNKPLSKPTDFANRVDHYLLNKHSSLANFDIDETEVSIPADMDDDLLSAFADEAHELLESSGQAIKSWSADTGSEQDYLQLQRDLHTLKGGARLTGVSPMADLSHQIETLVLAVCDGFEPADEDFFDLLQRCQDKLAEMQEQIANRIPVTTALSLIAEITVRTEGQLVEIDDRPLPAPEKLRQDSTDKELLFPIEPNEKVDDDNSPPVHVEQVRVRADLLDYLTNFAGEVSISRDRVTQQHSALRQQLREMEDTVSRLHDQLRNLEIETETQILFRYEDERIKEESDFDPLELDRFSVIQQLSRGLTESVIDLHDISHSMDTLFRETDTILLQQSRLNTDLQQGLMTTRLLPFSGIVGRLERIVRQTATELGKKTDLRVRGSELDIDRTILDRLVAPLEHILRNAIAHGIEDADHRLNIGKHANGQLTIIITREGSEIVVTISDDGQGINIDKVREKAINQGLIDANNIPSDDELIQLILTSGFSTADTITQVSGRGVGMDVVSNQIRELKGRLSIRSKTGKGSTFIIRLPLTLSVIQALLIRVQDEFYALPLSTVAAGERISTRDIKLMLGTHKPQYDFHGEKYRFMPLSSMLGKPLSLPENLKHQLPLLLFRSGDLRIALLIDDIISNREIVIKSVGTQLGHISAINGATILGDGRVVFILDIPTLMSKNEEVSIDTDDATNLERELEQLQQRLPTALVVDDSITMRKATSNLLHRLGFDVMTAKDGVDALSQLHERKPDIILLDVEMPRMDGFEFASIVRNDQHFRHLPIIMITSRTGSKHRDRAMEIGVNAYLGKPYQELELVKNMQTLMGKESFQEPAS